MLGKPSSILADKLEKTEKARIANQVEKLGPEGLEEVERKLEAAKKEHSKCIPGEILTSFAVPDVKSIYWIPVQTVQEPGEGRKSDPYIASTNGELQKHIESDGKPLSFFVEYDHVKACALSLFFVLISYSPHSPISFVSTHFSHWPSCPITFVLTCIPTWIRFSLSRLSGTME